MKTLGKIFWWIVVFNIISDLVSDREDLEDKVEELEDRISDLELTRDL